VARAAAAAAEAQRMHQTAGHTHTSPRRVCAERRRHAPGGAHGGARARVRSGGRLERAARAPW
jgi:hypothetical protein